MQTDYCDTDGERRAEKALPVPVISYKEAQMNKIYKVVWNAARASYVVGSEFIKASQTGGILRIDTRRTL